MTSLPQRIADLARAACWIENVGLNVLSEVTPHGGAWYTVTSHNMVWHGAPVYDDLVGAVQSAVDSVGREWTEWDDRLFGAPVGQPSAQ